MRRAVALAVVLVGCASESKGTPLAPKTDAASSICPAPPPEVLEGLRASGDAGVLVGTLLTASPVPVARFRNDWTIEVGNARGEPLADAELTFVETYMVEHSHAGQPSATFERLAEPGRFRAVLNFQMRGPWEVRFSAESPTAGSDRIVFDVCIPD